MKVLLLVPNLRTISGGVGNIYKVIDLPEFGNIEYFFVNSAKPLSPLISFLNLIRLYIVFTYRIFTRKYDLVHLNPSLNTKSFYRDGLFLKIAKIRGTKVLTFFHGWDEKLEKKIGENKITKKWFLKTIAKSDKFIVLGQVFKNKLLSLGVPSKTPFFIQTTVADDSFLSNLDLPKKIGSFDNHVKVLFISRLVKEKGLFIAIDAFAILTGIIGGNFQKLSLTVAGSGPELDKAKSYVVKKGLKNIEFLGYVTGSEKGKLLVQSHILLLPTFYGEGLPCTVLEGMLYGMPVISRNNAGIPDVIKNELNGYVTDSLEPEIFAGFLKDIILNKSKYMGMAIRNHNTGKEQFTSSKVRNRILSAYGSFG